MINDNINFEKKFLISDLSSLDKSTKINAIEQLGNFVDDETYAALLQLKSDPDPAIRYFANKTMNKITESKLSIFNNKPKEVQTNVNSINNKILRDTISGGDQKEKIEALKEIDKLNNKSFLPFLLERLNAENDNFVIASLVKLIGKFGNEDQIKTLSLFLNHQDKRIIANTIEGLEAIGTKEIIPLIVPLVYDNDNRVKANAAKLLSKFGEANVNKILHEMINSDEIWMRDSAIFALSQIADKDSIDLIENATKDTDKNIANHAAKALELIKSNTNFSSVSDSNNLNNNKNKVSDINKICDCLLSCANLKVAPVEIQELLKLYKTKKDELMRVTIELKKDLENYEKLKLYSTHEKALTNLIKNCSKDRDSILSGIGEIILSETIKNNIPINDLTLPIVELKNNIDDINNDLCTNEKYKTFLGRLAKNQRQKEYDRLKIELENALKNLEKFVYEEKIESDFVTENLKEKINNIQEFRSKIDDNKIELSRIIDEKNQICSIYNLNTENFDIEKNELIEKIKKKKEVINQIELHIKETEVKIDNYIINNNTIKWNNSLVDNYILEVKTQNAKLNSADSQTKYDNTDFLSELKNHNYLTPDFYKNDFEDSYLTIAKKVFIGQETIISYYRNIEEKSKLVDLASKIKCSSTQLSNIYFMAQNIAKYFNVTPPTVYVCYKEDKIISTEGLANPWIEINTETIESIEDNELYFYIARQMAHIQCNHLIFHMIINKMVEYSKDVLNNVPGINLIPMIDKFPLIQNHLKIALYPFMRSSEFSADAAAYLAIKGDLDVCCNAILKETLERPEIASKTSVKEFYKQIEIIDSMTNFMANFSKKDEVFPYGQFRIRELIKYASSERGKTALKLMKKW